MSQYPIGHPVNKKFVFGVLSKHPALKKALRAEWLQVSRQQDYVEANLRLARLHDRLKLGNTGLFMDSPDHLVKNYCEAKAKKTEKDVMDFAARGLKEMLFDYVVKVVNEAGLDFPIDDINDYEHEEMLSAIKRVCCVKWWRRQVRKMMAREVEAVARDLRLVNSNAGIYCSDYTANRRAEQRARNRDLLNSLEAVNQDEYCKTLAELSDLSVSNPENRRNELMVRIRGFEELAVQAGHTGLFLTLTCPSKYHAFLKAGYPNQKFSGATPRDAQKYLCDYIVRITGDCPLIDPNLLDKVIDFAIHSKSDYCSNIFNESFPDGQDIEVFRKSVLFNAWKKSLLLSEREHVTPFIIKNTDIKGGSLYNANAYEADHDYSAVRMTVDTLADFKAIKILINKLGIDKSWEVYTNYILNNPKNFSNQKIIRNSGYLESLKND